MGSRLGAHKEIEKLARKARKMGWDVEVTNRNHVRWTSPEGEVVRTALTANSGGLFQDMRRLKKAGIE